MIVKKIAGYVLSGIGILVLALGTVPGLRTPLTFISASIKDVYLMALGLLLAIVGVIIAGKSSSQKLTEVPIYQGKDVVGFRRIGKK